ncbi:hypothetical protein M3Y98_00812800 [Aphelenchoides besseyi]|nr:hypothetical protein M3Y98_00812800 [Aphelenchoides besseyi]KAI6212146.1 hypothetical protein M3Y96_00509400 [Aphelenchoides besseyi]
MRLIFVILLLVSIPLAYSRNPISKPKPESLDTNPLVCFKCELVVNVFHILNDAIIGGEGEEELRQKVIAFCDPIPELKAFCDDIKSGKLWEVIYKTLRDSLIDFYNLVAVTFLGCPSYDQIKANCEIN